MLAEVDVIVPKGSFSDSSHICNLFKSIISSSFTTYGIVDVPGHGGMGLFRMFKPFGVNVVAFESIRSCTLCFKAPLFSIVFPGAPE